jgi:hypothetical protein
MAKDKRPLDDMIDAREHRYEVLAATPGNVARARARRENRKLKALLLQRQAQRERTNNE